MDFNRPKGLIPDSLTAFKENYELDEERMREHIKWLISFPDVHMISLTGGTGEWNTLNFEEYKRVWEIGVEVCKGKVQVWPNFGAESYEKALKLGDAARDAGADGIRIIHPHYTMYSPGNLYEYYRDLAKHFSDLSIMIYPQEWLAARPFPVDVLAKLADIDNIVGMKVAEMSYTELFRLYDLVKDKDFALVPGAIFAFYHLCKFGISNACDDGPLLNMAPELCGSFFRACTKGNWDAALSGLWVLRDLFAGTSLLRVPTSGGLMNFPGQWKYAMKLLGRPLGPARRPCSMPTPEGEKEIERTLIKAGLLKASPSAR